MVEGPWAEAFINRAKTNQKPLIRECSNTEDAQYYCIIQRANPDNLSVGNTHGNSRVNTAQDVHEC